MIHCEMGFLFCPPWVFNLNVYGKAIRTYNDDDLLEIYEKLSEYIFDRLDYKDYDLKMFGRVKKELGRRGCIDVPPFLGRGQGYSTGK